MKKNIIFSGVMKKFPDGGDSMKNKLFVERFKEVYDKVWVVGFNKDSWHLFFFPFKIMWLLLVSIAHPRTRIVLSSNSWESNIIIKILGLFGMSKRIYFWVVGGAFHNAVGVKYPLSRFQKIHTIYVQSPKMVEVMRNKGFNNVMYVPNSKRIDYYPTIKCRDGDSKVKFVFLSRIHPDKGIRMIMESAKWLNDNGYNNRFTIDFYGKVFRQFENEFLSRTEQLQNVEYKGYLNLANQSNYDVLSKYDVMLFPTYWYGEGFPGIVIDAYIAGLPIIASDWNFNSDVVSSETGTILPAKDSKSLLKEMLNYIEGVYDIAAMKTRCQQVARNYDNRYVLSVENLKKIGML